MGDGGEMTAPSRMPRRMIVIGGGPAGLTAARTLQKRNANWTPLVLEANDIVGGISRTESHNGYRFDIGGHRFFTKVPEVTQFWRETLGDKLITRPRLSRIYYNGKYYAYPLKIFNALGNLGLVEAALIMFSYAKSQVAPVRPEETFDAWVTNRFGKRLFDTFFKTYTEKVWGIPCSEIRADWAAQRIKNLSVFKAVWNALTGANDTVSLIEQFEYPHLGPGQMWEVCAAQVEQAGGSVALKHRVEAVHRKGQRVTGVTVVDAEGETSRVAGDSFINSMDLRTLLKVMDPPPPAHVLAAAEKLSYRDFLIVTLVLDHPDPFPDNWIYVHSPAVSVGRIQNFRAWSEDMVPNARTASIGMEYFCHEGDGLWTMTDEALRAKAARELEAIGLAPAKSVIDSAIIRQPKAYPVYDGEYTENLGVVRDWLSTLQNFQTVGRNGMHRYNNQDHSMLTAMLAVENALGANHDLWSVNVERSYHEEFVTSGRDGTPVANDVPDYSVIIPARNAAATIERSVRSVQNAATTPREIIVVDDGSTDATARIAREAGAEVISHRSTAAMGPAQARNIGARHASSEYLLFLDADVVANADAPGRLVAAISQDDGVTAAFGAYGQEQACSNLAARYANLRHHYFHQNAASEAETFWTGIGAVQARTFSQLRGFNEDIREPAMEDIEFGARLRAAGGRIKVVAAAQGTHLKNWRLTQLWHDDIFRRAIPWSTLIVHRKAPASLNAGPIEKVKALFAGLTMAALVLAPWLPSSGLFGAGFGLTYLVLNRKFFGVLARHGGIRTTLAGVLLHFAYHLYATGSFLLAVAGKWLRVLPLPETADALVTGSLSDAGTNQKR